MEQKQPDVYERRLLYWVRRYNYAALLAVNHSSTEEERARAVERALRSLHNAARIYRQALQMPGITPKYLDSYLSQRTKLRRKYSYYLQQLSKYPKMRDLRRLARELKTVDMVALVDGIAYPPKTRIHPNDDLGLYVSNALSSLSQSNEQEAVEAARSAILAAIQYMPVDVRFEKLFRALLPCAWCGATAPLTSDGFRLKHTTINSVYLRLPCCDECMEDYNEPNINNIIVPLFVYISALEAYLAKLLTAEQDATYSA
jgi:hypothetical protein